MMVVVSYFDGRLEMILKPAPVSTRQFLFAADKNQFIGEISMTNGFGQVFDDACDEGLTLVSHKTGKEVAYAVQETHRDREREITHWTLIPADRKLQHLPTIVLFND